MAASATDAGGLVRRLGGATHTVLDQYARDVLGCDPALARSGAVQVLASRQRALPAWGGYVLPIIGLSFERGAVIAARPDLAEAVTVALGSTLRLSALDRAGLARVRRAVQQLTPHAFHLAGDLLAADAATLAPPTAPRRAELIPVGDPAGLALRHRFDGAVFGVRGPRGSLVSWAALKVKSAGMWEIAVATEPEYRGRGHARDVVAAAAAYALDHGCVPIYVHDHENRESAFVARALGFRRYAEIVLAEY